MMTGPRGNIFCLLTLYVHALTADTDPVLRVETMNNIFTHPGWTASYLSNTAVGIVVQRTETGETQILNMGEILATDSNYQIVTQYNVDNKVRQAHQFLSCRYVHVIRMCYDFSVGAAHLCAKIDVESESSECSRIFWHMVGKIDGMMSRLQGMFSCLRHLSPSKQLDKDVPEIVDDFKKHYDSLSLDSISLDKENRDTIIERTAKLMDIALNRLLKFCDRFCKLISLGRTNDDISRGAEIVQTLEGSNPPIHAVRGIHDHLNTFVEVCVTDYDENTLGFKYDPRQNTTSVMNEPYVLR